MAPYHLITIGTKVTFGRIQQKQIYYIYQHDSLTHVILSGL
jgi:hypothetical protein